MNRLRILLADDHEAVLRGVRSLLEAEFDIVGEVRDGAALLDAVEALRPDVVVLDISMPVVDGIEAARRLRSRRCQSKLIFYTIHDERMIFEAAMETGASGYVLKAQAHDDLIAAIRAIQRGDSYFSPSLARPQPGNAPDKNRDFS